MLVHLFRRKASVLDGTFYRLEGLVLIGEQTKDSRAARSWAPKYQHHFTRKQHAVDIFHNRTRLFFWVGEVENAFHRPHQYITQNLLEISHTLRAAATPNAVTLENRMPRLRPSGR